MALYKNNNTHNVRLTGSMVYNLPAGECITTQEEIAVLPSGVVNLSAMGSAPVQESVAEVAVEEPQPVAEVVVEEPEAVAEVAVEEPETVSETHAKTKRRGRPRKTVSAEAESDNSDS